MNEEEFKKKLESILANLYRIDREVKNYLDTKKLVRGEQDYKKSFERDKPKADERYKM